MEIELKFSPNGDRTKVFTKWRSNKSFHQMEIEQKLSPNGDRTKAFTKWRSN